MTLVRRTILDDMMDLFDDPFSFDRLPGHSYRKDPVNVTVEHDKENYC